MKRCHDYRYKNSQLDKFNYQILYKDFLLNQIDILTDIKIFIRHMLYTITKVRKIYAPQVSELREEFYIDKDLEYVFINKYGIVFEIIDYDAYKVFMYQPVDIFTTSISRRNGYVSKIWYNYSYQYLIVTLAVNFVKSRVETHDIHDDNMCKIFYTGDHEFLIYN